jgi:hypothetical protein
MDSRNQISKILKKFNTIKIILKKMNKKMWIKHSKPTLNNQILNRRNH